ncbi:MAG: hypothetical protein K0S53_218 [Bacteroidetes bacterium]|jgi:hypothetical protein|nr:hypothetical protein [Bacteroidota bacterium]MDF2452753.1 hypothetical protein [Bacteroidota bacterium]
MRTVFFVFLFFLSLLTLQSQTTVGIGIYTTGTETGLGFRLNKEKRLSLDARITKANFYSNAASSSSFLSEVSGIYRLIRLEKIRFHIGIGFRSNWNLMTTHKHGAVIPIGVEAFPFPFQNAGLFFEAAPYFESDDKSNWQGGLRTVAGFAFYFQKKLKKTNNEKS